jgi:alanine racemase
VPTRVDSGCCLGSPPLLQHTTQATVDLSALVHNLSQIRERLSPQSHVMAVVKANAYGHGAIEVSRALVGSAVARLAVASVQEGVILRQAGINADILVLVDLFDRHVQDLIAYRLTPVITEQRLLPPLAEAAASRNQPLGIHIKVDTGMGRLGFSPSELSTLFNALPGWKSLRIDGFMTHLADSDGNDPSHTEQQLKTFRGLLEQVEQRGITIPFVHVANSAAIVRYPQSHFSLVRPGIMLYGYHTLPDIIPCPRLEPVLSLRTTVMQLRTIKPGETVSYNRTFVAKRPSTIAVLPVGYADGYSRRLSNQGFVLIKGTRAPIVGLICMDMTMVDVTDIPSVRVGDAVTLIGREGHDAIWADQLAAWTGTIPYEVLCAIGPRIPRLYSSS